MNSWYLGSAIPLASASIVTVWPVHLGYLYRISFADPRRERLFLAWVSFVVTFGVVRLLTHAIRKGDSPFHNIVVGGRHIHHMVWGITLLLLVGYLWLIQVGTGMSGEGPWVFRITALLFGFAAALTLDEFALWFNLKDVYWLPEGRESIDAVILFGALLSAGFWGAPFFKAIGREIARLAAE